MRIKFTIKKKIRPEEVLKRIQKVLFKSMIKMEELAIQKVPVDTGLLKGSIKIIPMILGQNSYTLVATKEYASAVEFGCFFGNSHRYKILTKRGYKSLKNVKIGDLVLTHKNRWRKVLSKPIHEVKNIIPRYTIKLKSGKKVTVTEEHPFLTKRGWIKAKNLMNDDIIMEVI